MLKNNSIIIRILNYVPALAVILVSIALVAFYVYPKSQLIVADNQVLEALSLKNATLTQKKKDVLAIDTKELINLEKKVETAVPSEKTFDGLLTGIDSLSKEAGSTLLLFNSSPGLISTQSGRVASVSAVVESTRDSGLKFLDASIGLSSNPSSLVSLSEKIGKSGRLVTMKKIGYNSKTVLTGANTTIDLSVYFLPKQQLDVITQKIYDVSAEEREIISKVDSFNRFNIQVPVNFDVNPNPFGVVQQGSSSPSLRP